MPRSTGSITKSFSTTMAGAQKGGAAMLPPGGFQSAGHRKCAIGVLNWSQIRYQIHPDLSQMANLKSQTLYARQRSYTPLFVSPQEPGDHRSPAQNFCFLCLVGSCWAIFSPSGARLKNDNEKTPKKTRKSRILASQNPPKIRPKSAALLAAPGVLNPTAFFPSETLIGHA